MKICEECKEEKPLDKFEIYFNKLIGKPYHRNTCKTCINKRRKIRKDNKEKINIKNTVITNTCIINARARFKRLSSNDGLDINYSSLTLDWYNTTLENQKGGCAICGKTPEQLGYRLYIDHCHSTGKLRGLLCNNCNTGLGALGDNIEGVAKALNYLIKS